MNREAMKINKDAVRQVLAGNVPAIGDAFWWREAPQGGIYWSKRYRGHAPLSEADIAFLESLLTDEPQPDMAAIAEEMAKALDESRIWLEAMVAETPDGAEDASHAMVITITKARAALAAYRAAKGGEA